MLARVLIVVLVLVTLALLVLVPLLLDPAAARGRVLALFRRPGRKPSPPEPDHYYRPYWS